MKLLDMCLAGGNVLRYHTHPYAARHQSVAEHSFRAYHIAVYLSPGVSPRVLHEIMMHDIAEAITGDSPFTAKQATPELKEILDRAEQRIRADLGAEHDLTAEEYGLVKLADVLEMGTFAAEQIEMGNRRYIEVAKNVLHWLDDHDELMRQYLASYQLAERIRKAYYTGAK